jgi:hypothetical protein
LFFSASFLVVAFQVLIIGVLRFLPVAVVRLVVDDEDVLHAHQVGHHPLQHLAFAFERPEFLAGAALQELPPTLGYLDALAQLEGVVVGDDDLGAAHVVEQVARQQFAVLVVAVGVVRLQDAQAVLDRQAGRADQEAAGEVPAARPAHRIDRLPGDEHGHDRGLAGAGGQFQGEAQQLGIGVPVRRSEMVENALAVSGLRRDLGEPDRGFHGFHLAEERSDTAEPCDDASAAAGGRSPVSPATDWDWAGIATNPHARELR